jgi:DNA modification methylase
MSVEIINGDVRFVLSILPSNSFDCIVTSPPYWGLRDYGVDGQIGLEPTMTGYLETMVGVCRELRRVLKPEGTFWLNIGDSYAGSGRGGATPPAETLAGGVNGHGDADSKRGRKDGYNPSRDPKGHGLKHKDLCMIPNRLAILLQEDGWYVRSEIIWHKPNPMPESVVDRPSCSHEKLWLLTKAARYFYDAAAIRNPPSEAFLRGVADGYNGEDTKEFGASGAQLASSTKSRVIAGARAKIDKQRGHGRRHAGFNDRWDNLTKAEQQALGSNARNVWTITTKAFKGAHFATFPPDLVERCIKAGCVVGGSVLDPFGGSGTTGMVADRLGRSATLIELNESYVEIAKQRIELGK